MRAALVSGGKDSLYAAHLAWPVDVAIILVYEFPRPSPHLANLSKSVETWLSVGVPVVVARLRRGREREETVGLLRRLGVDEVVAGDVYIEDHLRYMEGVAAEAGARLIEPLWGMEPLELLYREVEWGIRAVVIGVRREALKLLGKILDRDHVDDFVGTLRRLGFDPLGERGEYHTLVVESPLHEKRVEYEVVRAEEYDGYMILRLV